MRCLLTVAYGMISRRNINPASVSRVGESNAHVVSNTVQYHPHFLHMLRARLCDVRQAESQIQQRTKELKDAHISSNYFRINLILKYLISRLFARHANRDAQQVFFHSLSPSSSRPTLRACGLASIASFFAFSSSISHWAHKKRPFKKSASGLHSQTAKCAGKFSARCQRCSHYTPGNRLCVLLS